MPQQTLRVVANPYAHLDHEGRPCGRVMLDPVEHLAPHNDYSNPKEPRHERRYVGAWIDAQKTRITKRAKSQHQTNQQDTVWAFTTEPQTIPQTNYYLRYIQHGALLPADAATAAVAGVAFVEPEKALALARHRALGFHFRERPENAIPEWATPEDLATNGFLSKERKADHVLAHAKKLADAKAKADAEEKAAKAAAQAAQAPADPQPTAAAPAASVK